MLERIGSLPTPLPVPKEEGSLVWYLQEISKEVPLKPKEEAELAQRVRRGDRDALDRPDELMIREAMRTDIRRALAVLSPREAEIIRLYFGIDQDRAWTLEEIGGQIGLTRERVRQLKERAIQRLRRTALGRILRTYLG